LKLVRTIQPEIDKDHFIASVSAIAADDGGCIYAFDRLQGKCFKFDKNFRFVREFGRFGPGPGEFGKGGMKTVGITGNCLYINDSAARKLICFNMDGRFLQEWRFPSDTNIAPLRTAKGEWFILRNETVEIADEKQKTRKTLLTIRENSEFLFASPLFVEYPGDTGFYSFTLENTWIGFTHDHRIAVYLTNPSELFVFQHNKPVRSIRLLPQNALSATREAIMKSQKEKSELSKYRIEGVAIPLFSSFFVDQDNPRFFFLQHWHEDRCQSYCFDWDGRLVGVYTTDIPNTPLMLKKNGLYYGKDDEKIYIFKEAM